MAGAGSGFPVHALLLAAGSSRRFGGGNKLLAEIDGVPLVRRVAERVLASRVAGLIAVTGHEADAVKDALAGLEVSFAHNPDHTEGMASSLRMGIAALPGETSGAMVVLADMPGLTSSLADRLIGKFAETGGARIVYPVDPGGAQRNPVIWPRRFFAELQALEGDAGAKHLIAAHQAESHAVPAGGDGQFRDIDTEGDLDGWSG